MVTAFLQTTFFFYNFYFILAAFLVTGFSVMCSFHAIFSLYSESCVLGTDQKCPDYQGFLNFQVSYMLSQGIL